MSDVNEEGLFVDKQGKKCSWRLKEVQKMKNQQKKKGHDKSERNIICKINLQFRVIRNKDGHITLVSQAKETKVRYYELGQDYLLRPSYAFRLWKSPKNNQ